MIHDLEGNAGQMSSIHTVTQSDAETWVLHCKSTEGERLLGDIISPEVVK